MTDRGVSAATPLFQTLGPTLNIAWVGLRGRYRKTPNPHTPLGTGVNVDSLVQALAASMDSVSLMGRIAEQACAFMGKADGAAVTLLRASDNAYVTVSGHGVLATTPGFVAPG